jgi:hypothetical protein
LNNTKELDLLLEVLNLPFREKEQAEKVQIVSTEIDKQYFIDLGEFHSILPQLKYCITTYHVNNDLFDNIAVIQKQGLIRNLSFGAELIRLSKVFEKENIQVVWYKGYMFTKDIYPELSARKFGDLDFLFSKKDYDKVLQILLEDGYQLNNSSVEEGKKQLQHYYAEISLFKRGNGFTFIVEPHWYFGPPSFIKKIDIEDIQKEIQVVDLYDTKINTFSQEMNLIVLALHHGAKESWTKLKYIYDIGFFLKKNNEYLDWQQVFELGKKYGVLNHLLIGIYICQKITPIKLNKRLKEAIQNQLVVQYGNARIIEYQKTSIRIDATTQVKNNIILQHNFSKKIYFISMFLKYIKYYTFIESDYNTSFYVGSWFKLKKIFNKEN